MEVTSFVMGNFQGQTGFMEKYQELLSLYT